MFYNETLICYEGELQCLTCYEELKIEPEEDSSIQVGYPDYIPRCHRCHSRQLDVELTDEGLLYETATLVSQIADLFPRPDSPTNSLGVRQRIWHLPPFTNSYTENFTHRVPDSYSEYLEDVSDILGDSWGYITQRSPLEPFETACKGLVGIINSVFKSLIRAEEYKWTKEHFEAAESTLKVACLALEPILLYLADSLSVHLSLNLEKIK